MMTLHPANSHNLVPFKNTADALLQGSTSVQKGLHVVAACGMFRNLLFAKPMGYIYYESSTVRLKTFLTASNSSIPKQACSNILLLACPQLVLQFFKLQENR
jgi:hypothetical protein